MEKLIFNQEKLQKIDNEVDEIMSRLNDQDLKELIKKYPDQTIIKTEKDKHRLERVLDFQRVYEQNYPPEREKFDELFIMLLDEIEELNRAVAQDSREDIKKETADVFNCVIMLANHLNVDLEKEASKKTDRNLKKYNPTKIDKLREENIALREARELLRQAWDEKKEG